VNTVMLLGPSLSAVSGVSTHLNQLLHSRLSDEFKLLHFQVGSQGRNETSLQKVIRLGISPILFAWRLLRQNPKVIHVNTSMDSKGYWRDLVYLIIARALRKKVVYQVHGGALPQQFFRNCRPLSYVLKRTLRAANTVVVLGQESMAAYQAFTPGLNLKVIPNAISPGDDPLWKRISSCTDKPLHLVYIGRLDKSKGVFEIIDALALLHRNQKRMHLVIAGTGPAESEMHLKVQENGLQNYVRFMGVVHGSQKERVWNESDLFLFPTYYEALPYALLESMAARTPPLVCPVGEIPDVVVDGVHGVFVPCRDADALATAICRLDSDRDLINRMGELGRLRILECYTIERLSEDFCRVYRDVLSSSTRQISSRD
jgi:glycosyltransferase involved in cell wall biosynthesis